MPKLFQLPRLNGEKRVSFGIALLIIVVVAAALLRFIEWVKPETSLPLLTDAPGIVRLTDFSQIGTYVNTQVTAPMQLFGAELQVIGVYPSANNAFPEKSVALVYVRQGKRYVEINYRPNTTIEKELAGFADLKKETIVLTSDVNATFVQLRDQSFCKNHSEATTSVCQFTRLLAFERDGTVITIFADGRHATDGELIQMARSIIR